MPPLLAPDAVSELIKSIPLLGGAGQGPRRSSSNRLSRTTASYLPLEPLSEPSPSPFPFPPPDYHSPRLPLLFAFISYQPDNERQHITSPGGCPPRPPRLPPAPLLLPRPSTGAHPPWRPAEARPLRPPLSSLRRPSRPPSEAAPLLARSTHRGEGRQSKSRFSLERQREDASSDGLAWLS